MSELLPCPFCGGEARVERDSFGGLFYMGCLNDECMGFIGLGWTYKNIESWNRRADECDREELLALAEEIDANGDALLADTPLLVGSVGLMRCYAERIRKALGVE